MHYRNKIVLVNTFYGRVVKRLKNGNFLVLDCGLHFWSVPENSLMVSDYRGYLDTWTNRYVYMTSLRKLKKMASRYHGNFAHNTPDDYEYIKEV